MTQYAPETSLAGRSSIGVRLSYEIEIARLSKKPVEKGSVRCGGGARRVCATAGRQPCRRAAAAEARGLTRSPIWAWLRWWTLGRATYSMAMFGSAPRASQQALSTDDVGRWETSEADTLTLFQI